MEAAHTRNEERKFYIIAHGMKACFQPRTFVKTEITIQLEMIK